jgi:hypothetical protein
MLSNLGMLFPFFLFANLMFVFFWLTFKWKKLWIPILGYVLVFSPICTYVPLNATQEVPEGTIKLISYNVCQYGGNYKYEEGFDTVFNYLKRQQQSGRPKNPNMHAERGGSKEDDMNYNARKKQNQEEIDAILDKIRKSGYDSLTKEEKKKLFDASNQR